MVEIYSPYAPWCHKKVGIGYKDRFLGWLVSISGAPYCSFTDKEIIIISEYINENQSFKSKAPTIKVSYDPTLDALPHNAETQYNSFKCKERLGIYEYMPEIHAITLICVRRMQLWN